MDRRNALSRRYPTIFLYEVESVAAAVSTATGFLYFYCFYERWWCVLRNLLFKRIFTFSHSRCFLVYINKYLAQVSAKITRKWYAENILQCWMKQHTTKSDHEYHKFMPALEYEILWILNIIDELLHNIQFYAVSLRITCFGVENSHFPWIISSDQIENHFFGHRQNRKIWRYSWVFVS